LDFELGRQNLYNDCILILKEFLTRIKIINNKIIEKKDYELKDAMKRQLEAILALVIAAQTLAKRQERHY